MATAGGASSQAVPLEQMIALNDEIVSLVRAGVPLEHGLQQLADDRADGLGRLGGALSERMSRGESLVDALAAEGDRFPRVYRTVVEAGLRAGRLTVALEALSAFGWQLVELRRRIGLALMYPVIVGLLAYGLFLVFVLELVERLYDTYVMFHVPIPATLAWLLDAGRSINIWWWIPPVALLVFFGWWLSTGGPQLLNFEGLSRPLGWIPGLKRIGRNYRYANFSELLALLVEHDVPLDEALRLSADATGDESLRRSAENLGEAIRRGEPPDLSGDAGRGMPPFLRWLLSHGYRQGSLSVSLRHAADRYRRRADEQTEWFKLAFPILAGLTIGGAVTLLYALTMFLPFSEILHDLASEEAVH